jgi:YVTN family beta-propeller protein
MQGFPGRRWLRAGISLLLPLGLAGDIASAGAQTPQATELSGNVFAIHQAWTIGGEGDWDYLTLDTDAQKLYIAHGPVVQVVDVKAGTKVGEVTGLQDAHSVALDDHGQFGFVSDGPANTVKVFDRQTLAVVASIPTAKNPRAIVFDPVSRLVLAICPDITVTARKTPVSNTSGSSNQGAGTSDASASGSQNHPSPDSNVFSTITLIDPDTQKQLADVLMPGRLGFAVVDGKGEVYVAVTNRNQIVHFNVLALASELRPLIDSRNAETRNTEASPEDGDPGDGASVSATPHKQVLIVDWSDGATGVPPIAKSLHTLRLQDCEAPKGLAIDRTNLRLFAACDNMKMQVLNATNGQIVATLPIGNGTDAIGYDADRGLIYTSNGGGVGSLTVIRQHETDSYAVIQEVPTQARARTLAINPTSGDVYLVANVSGFDLTHKGGVGDLKTAPLKGSFQVLVIGK